MDDDGSGTWTRSNAKGDVEGRSSIDVRAWQRGELLYPGNSFSWSLNERSSIRVQVGHGQLRLEYSIQPLGEEKQDIDDPIRLSTTPCNYGGARRWFVCPDHPFGKRVAVLYWGGKHFRCRHCCGLAYTSQREDRKYRALRRLQKLRKQLGATGPLDMDSPVPPKPEGMRKATYARLKQKIRQVQWDLQEAESEWYSQQWNKGVERALKRRNQGRNGAIARSDQGR
jgi:hypothetical protein